MQTNLLRKSSGSDAFRSGVPDKVDQFTMQTDRLNSIVQNCLDQIDTCWFLPSKKCKAAFALSTWIYCAEFQADIQLVRAAKIIHVNESHSFKAIRGELKLMQANQKARRVSCSGAAPKATRGWTNNASVLASTK